MNKHTRTHAHPQYKILYNEIRKHGEFLETTHLLCPITHPWGVHPYHMNAYNVGRMGSLHCTQCGALVINIQRSTR